LKSSPVKLQIKTDAQQPLNLIQPLMGLGY